MRDLVQLLESEARRKPDVAALLERARKGCISKAEIEEAPLPLPWFRKALNIALDRAETSRKQEIAKKELDAASETIQVQQLADSANLGIGMTVVYTGETCWVKQPRGFQVEIKTGDLLFFPKEGGAWLNQTFFEKPPHSFKNFQIVEEQTRHEYVEAYAVFLSNKF